MLPNSLSSPSITCKYYTIPDYHLPMAFLSCLPCPSPRSPLSPPLSDRCGSFPFSLLLCDGALHKRARAARECSPAVLYLFLFQFPFSSHPSSHIHSPSSFQPTPLFSATSALATRPLLAEARMLTALSIEQYSFSTFTTLLYRPPCGGIALDVYNYS